MGREAKIKTGGEFDYYPSSINAYFYVITLLKDRSIVKEDVNTSWVDANNQYGNHLGSIDFAFKLNPSWGEIFAYKQTAYETGRIFSLVTANDGIYGLSVKPHNNKIIKGFTIEYLYTANQGLNKSTLAKIFNLNDPHYPEQESYFNNNHRGWVYWNKGIGTPLIIVDSESRLNAGSNFKHNAVKSIYLGAYGTFPLDINWKIRLSSSQHGYIEYGNNYPVSRYLKFVSQFSYLIELNKKLKTNLDVNFKLGIDRGEEIYNSSGISIGIKYLVF